MFSGVLAGGILWWVFVFGERSRVWVCHDDSAGVSVFPSRSRRRLFFAPFRAPIPTLLLLHSLLDLHSHGPAQPRRRQHLLRSLVLLEVFAEAHLEWSIQGTRTPGGVC